MLEKRTMSGEVGVGLAVVLQVTWSTTAGPENNSRACEPTHDYKAAVRIILKYGAAFT